MPPPCQAPLLLHSLRLCAQTASCLVLFPRFLGTAFMLWLLDFLCIRVTGPSTPGSAGNRSGAQQHGEEVPPDDPLLSACPMTTACAPWRR